jgi:hypothetical protein
MSQQANVSPPHPRKTELQKPASIAHKAIRLQTATTATTLSPGGVGGSGGDVLDTADLHAGAGKGTEGGLGTRTGGLGRVA